MPTSGNILASLPASAETMAGELAETLAVAPGARIERIVSFGHASPSGFWYGQDEAEWVMVLAGRAELTFADGAEPCRLGPGDYVLIPAHRRHRVAMTDPAAPTVWLAVHLAPAPPG